MGIFTRKDEATVTASGAIIDLNDSDSVKRFALAKRSWQEYAWTSYDELAEVHYPANFVGSSLSRFTLHLGRKDPGERVPVAVEDPSSPAEQAAVQLIEDFMGDECSQAEHLRRFGLNWTVAADMWLIGTPNGDQVNWETLSVSELLAQGDGVFRRVPVGHNDTSFNTTLPPNTLVRRIWRGHPRYSRLADGALNALQADCQRLSTLNDSITSRLLSRLASNGIMVFPNNVSINGTQVTADGKNPFFQTVLNRLEQSMNGEMSKGALPIVVTGPNGTAKEIAHVTMDRLIDQVEMELRKELRQNIAMGMDLPPEVQTGLGDSNHFSTWSIQDSSYRQHLLPVVDQAIDAWTRFYLQPALRSLGTLKEDDIRGLCIMADGSNVVVRPNEGQDARELWDRDAISDSALRIRTGATDDEAPTYDERMRHMGTKYGNLALAVYGTPEWDKLMNSPEDIAFIQLMQLVRGHATEAGAGTGHPGTGAPAGTGGDPNPGSNAGTSGTNPNARVPVDNGGSSPGSPGRNAGQQPSAHAAERIAAAAQQALRSAEVTVGAKLRARAQAHSEVAAKVRREPNEGVYSHLSDYDLRAIGFTDADVLGLFTDALEDLRAFCIGQVGAAVANEYVGQLAMMKMGSRFTDIGFDVCQQAALGVLSSHSV